MSTRFTSRTNHVTVTSPDERTFVRAAFWAYLRRYVRRTVRPFRRTRTQVRSEYDGEATRLAASAPTMSWDDLMYGDPNRVDFVLVDDHIQWTGFTAPRTCNLKHLEDAVRALPDERATVVEFGSGTGRNLFHLKRAFPQLCCVGLELSPVSVDLARALAARFGVDAEFHVCDVTQVVPVAPRGANLVFTCHALEQMPRLVASAVARMCEMSSDLVLMLEPIPDLWSWDVRGITSRIRIRALDRMRTISPSLHRALASGEWDVLIRERLRNASNPLNETCELLLRRRQPATWNRSNM